MERNLTNESYNKKTITINLPKPAIDALDSIVQLDSKKNRSDLLRGILEDFIEAEKDYAFKIQAFLLEHPAPKSKWPKSKGKSNKYAVNGFSNEDTVITINAGKGSLPHMRMFIGKDKLFPSRSELIRCAVKRYLEQWIADWDKNNVVFFEKTDLPKTETIKIPLGNEYKEVKVLKVLDSPAKEQKPQVVKKKEYVPLGRNFPNDPFSNLGPEPEFEVDNEIRKKLTEDL